MEKCLTLVLVHVSLFYMLIRSWKLHAIQAEDEQSMDGYWSKLATTFWPDSQLNCQPLKIMGFCKSIKACYIVLNQTLYMKVRF